MPWAVLIYLVLTCLIMRLIISALAAAAAAAAACLRCCTGMQLLAADISAAGTALPLITALTGACSLGCTVTYLGVAPVRPARPSSFRGVELGWSSRYSLFLLAPRALVSCRPPSQLACKLDARLFSAQHLGWCTGADHI